MLVSPILLQENVSLKVLLLSMNGFSNRGAEALAQALEVNRTLEEVDITYNRIYDGGAVKLAQAIHKNEVLKYLYVSEPK